MGNSKKNQHLRTNVLNKKIKLTKKYLKRKKGENRKMSEFQIALNKIVEINKEIDTAIKEHNGKKSIVIKCEQISYNQLKSIPLETELPFISKYDQPSFEERKSWNSFWIVSPIIGKKNLREGKDEFLVAITKIQHKRPSFTIISAPKKNTLFIGFNNKAYKIENIDLSLNLDIDELLTGDNLINIPTEGFFFTIMKNRNRMNAKTEKLIDDFKLYKSGRIKEVIDESPMNLIGIAEGEYDFYPHLKSIYEWDIAPFDAIISATGNRVTQKDGILPLSYNSKTLKFAEFIAKNNFDIDSIDQKE